MSNDDIIKWLRKTPFVREECHVKGCHDRDIEALSIKPFDPIDHDDHDAKLCAEHRQWAQQRNAFTEEMYEPLRQERKRIGMKNIDRVQEWALPQGLMRKDVLDGLIKDDPYAKETLGLEDILE